MPRPRVVIFGCLVPLVFAQGLSAEEPFACLPTIGTARSFAGLPPSSARRFWYGSEALAVLLNQAGTWQGMGRGSNYRDKLFWWRKGYSGTSEPRPELAVSARRLDDESQRAHVSKATNAQHESLGGWAMLVMVEFPSPGCWEVTGRYKGEQLTFVVKVDD